MNNFITKYKLDDNIVLNALLVGFLCVIGIAFYFENWYIPFIPSVLLVCIYFIKDLRLLYFIMMASVPLSIALYIGSFSIDAPDEIINIFLLFILPGFVIYNYKKLDFSFLRQPITIILITMFAWACITTITSVNPFLSFKYLLAKAWYLCAYFLFTALFLKDWKDVGKLSRWVVATTTITIIYVMVRHAPSGFSFAEINFCVGPFYSNHVNYAVQLLVILPYLWLLGRINKYDTQKTGWWVIMLFVLFIVAIYFSFTRAAIGATILAIPFYYIIRWKLAIPAIVLSIVIGIGSIYYVLKDNKFFEYAPDYNKAISHHEFDDLLTATYNLEDISTMERVYRWVAAKYMIEDNWFLGVGPNNFYDTYKAYTINMFRTYVSDNPDKSTVHSYFMLQAIEQGVLGALLFFALIIYAFVIGQRLYHSESDPRNKAVIMAAMICILYLFIVLTINDVIESDKEGSFFYLSLGIIAGFHWRYIRRKRNQALGV